MKHAVTYLIVFVIVLSSLLVVAGIGKPRKPLDTNTVIGVLVCNALVIWGLLWATSA